MIKFSSLSGRYKLLILHFAFSAVLISALLGCCLFFWYPEVFFESLGLVSVLKPLVLVDLVIGPIVAFFVLKPQKVRREKVIDLAIIVGLQLSAFLYGTWVIYSGRPIFVVFEYDRFRIVQAYELDSKQIKVGNSKSEIFGVPSMPFIGLRDFDSPEEKMEFTLAALGGVSLSSREELWISYHKIKYGVAKASMPLVYLFERQKALGKNPLDLRVLAEKKYRYIPLNVGKSALAVVLDESGSRPIGYIDVDPFE